MTSLSYIYIYIYIYPARGGVGPILAASVEKHAPPVKTTGGNNKLSEQQIEEQQIGETTSFRSNKSGASLQSGAAEQFLLPDCGPRARGKGVFCSQTPGCLFLVHRLSY